MLIATATIGENPSRLVSATRIVMSAMISSCMFSITPPVAKSRLITGMTSNCRRPSFATSHDTPVASAPVRSTTVNAAEPKRIRKTTSAALAIPRGMATIASKRPTGLGSTGA